MWRIRLVHQTIAGRSHQVAAGHRELIAMIDAADGIPRQPFGRERQTEPYQHSGAGPAIGENVFSVGFQDQE